MTSTSIYIHEFSTGIQAERTADGGWVSRGFTGKYINRTIDPIPRAVQEAITNREFAVAEGASSDEPTVIGREVGYGEEWSVVAVVTRGRDDRGRSASVYRYFLCEGRGHLGTILAWMNTLRQAGQSYVFDPFETQTVGQPHEYTGSEPDVALRDELRDLLNAPPPIIIPSDSPCTPLLINKMAGEIPGDRPIAWGYKVEALEEPRGFQIIQPASSRAEELLRKAIASKPNTPAPIAGEKTLISAINGLIKRDRLKPEQLETIENALTNPQIDDSYWEIIFKGRGADKALKQGIYTPDMVRLLTLRAMVVPDTLPEFLDWMGKSKKDSYDVSESFQAEVRKVISKAPNLQNKVYEGVKLIIPRLTNQPELLESVVWLLNQNGVWRLQYERQFKNELDSDLTLMSRSARRKKGDMSFHLMDDQEWGKLFDELKSYWQSRSFPGQPKFQPLAQLFERLEDYKLAAFFYHVCFGVVPEEVFYKLTSQGFYCSVYGIQVQRKIGSIESLWLNAKQIGELIMPVYMVIPLLICTLALGAVGGRLTASKTEDNPTGEVKTTKIKDSKRGQQGVNQDVSELSSLEKSPESGSRETVEEKFKLADLVNFQSDPNFDEDQKQKALSQFTSKTKPALQEIVKSLQESKRDTNLVKKSLLITLFKVQNQEENIQITSKINAQVFDQSLQDPAQKEVWIKAIYNYQGKTSGLKADGIIDPGGGTANQLTKEVQQSLN